MYGVCTVSACHLLSLVRYGTGSKERGLKSAVTKINVSLVLDKQEGRIVFRGESNVV